MEIVDDESNEERQERCKKGMANVGVIEQGLIEASQKSMGKCLMRQAMRLLPLSLAVEAPAGCIIAAHMLQRLGEADAATPLARDPAFELPASA